MDTYGDFDLAGCLISEKHDGVQTRWDGEKLTSRDGKRINAPPGFLAALPKKPTRDELWAGRGICLQSKTESPIIWRVNHGTEQPPT